MRYEPATLAALASAAGFQRGELATAVALAVAASGGHPHHDHPIGLPGCGRYVGLWGIDADRWADYTPDMLYDPLRAAQAAYDLTRRCDGFGWSAHWRAGAERPHVERVAVELGRAPYRDREYGSITSVAYDNHLADLRARAARRIVRHHQWQIPTTS